MVQYARACVKGWDVEAAKFQLHSLRRLWKNTHPSAQGRVHFIIVLASLLWTGVVVFAGFSLHRFNRRFCSYCSRCKAWSSTISSPSISCWSRDLAMPSRYIPRHVSLTLTLLCWIDAHLVSTCWWKCEMCNQNSFEFNPANFLGPANSGIAGSTEKKDWPVY